MAEMTMLNNKIFTPESSSLIKEEKKYIKTIEAKLIIGITEKR